MIHLLYCGNGKVFDGLLTSLLSICMRDPSKDALHVTVLTMELTRMNPNFTPITQEEVSALEAQIRKFNDDSRVVRVDVSELYESELGHSPNEGCYCSPYTLLRLLSDKVDTLPDKFLYLDADIMFNRDIHLLYDIDVSNVEFAGANDHYGKYLVNPRYINAGVLLFNKKKCLETKLFEKARALINKKHLPFADQSALQRACTKKKVLPQRFNDQKFLHKHTVVRHFSRRLFYLPYPHSENIKQWEIEKVHRIFHYHQFDDIYEVYLSCKKELSHE